MTGKSTLLRKLSYTLYLDLLDLQLELLYRENPKVFWEEMAALRPGSKIIIDEIQKIPDLLNYVQMAMDQLGHQFILSGSSARKLKRGGANLLGGRALDLKLHPLSFEEIGKVLDLESVLSYGSLPKIYSLVVKKDWEMVKAYLRTYVSTYLKEEIQMEALTRNLGAFQRFFSVAAQSNGQVIEFANISRECSVPMTTVKEYFSIL
ncbi:MAG: ATP-binding protein, partial [Deltaproteobacteria bacterium]|nr:ATP-binding protein [Deltaproteobacteria bacterium]